MIDPIIGKIESLDNNPPDKKRLSDPTMSDYMNIYKANKKIWEENEALRKELEEVKEERDYYGSRPCESKAEERIATQSNRIEVLEGALREIAKTTEEWDYYSEASWKQSLKASHMLAKEALEGSDESI